MLNDNRRSPPATPPPNPPWRLPRRLRQVRRAARKGFCPEQDRSPVALMGHGRPEPLILQLPPGGLRAGGGVRRRHGHQPAAGRADRRGLRGPGPRGLQRALGGDPARRRRPGPPLVLRGRVRRGRDRHLRGLRPGAGGVRAGPPGPRAQPGRRHPGPGGGRRLLHPGPAPVGGREHRARHQVPHPRADPLRRPPRRLPGAGRRPPRGGRGPHHHRDGLRPAAGQSGHQRGRAGP